VSCPNFTCHAVLSVLRVSVVNGSGYFYHHEGTENTENALDSVLTLTSQNATLTDLLRPCNSLPRVRY
jgi:hypothetical protein